MGGSEFHILLPHHLDLIANNIYFIFFLKFYWLSFGSLHTIKSMIFLKFSYIEGDIFGALTSNKANLKLYLANSEVS